MKYNHTTCKGLLPGSWLLSTYISLVVPREVVLLCFKHLYFWASETAMAFLNLKGGKIGLPHKALTPVTSKEHLITL